MKTIIQLAKELSENLITSERRDEAKTKYVHLKDNTPEWMTDVIHKAHGDRLPDDDIYERVQTIVNNLAELDDNASEDDIQDRINEIEPDIYYNQLTGWLHARNDNLFYLDEALSEYGTFKTGSDLLQAAQSIYIREIADSLIQGLKELSESEE